MQNTDLMIGNGLLLLFVIIEAFIVVFYMKETLPWKELIMNLNSGHILLWIFRGLEVSAYFYSVQFLSLHLVDWLPYWLQWILAFFLWDFMFYWLHRTHHYFKILWNVHVVHHEGEHFSLSLGIRNSWYSSLTSFPYFVILAVLGFPVELFVAVSSIHYFIQFYNHNHLIKNSGWLDLILVTPKHHRVHHGRNNPYIDKNFGGTLVLWDKLFGTFQEEQVENPVEFGIDHPVESYNPVWVNNVPFVKPLSKWIVSVQKPLNYPTSLLVSGALLLFALLLAFINFEDVWKSEIKWVWFGMVFLGTIANGLLSEGKRLGVWLWAVLTIPVSLAILTTYSLEHVGLITLLLIAFVHGLITLVWFLKTKLSL